ncbi:hypothetical protein HAX54_031267 [Datura stramonium]|uniref:Uncharacterized protein n=1 Tax=Datura stramonium TaxID=4076 RepID=A0ABS8SBS2_DATST|nr:hypothetical protein [Datura stramonium]
MVCVEQRATLHGWKNKIMKNWKHKIVKEHDGSVALTSAMASVPRRYEAQTKSVEVRAKVCLNSSNPPRWVRVTEPKLRDGLRATLRLFIGVPNSSELARWLRGTEPKLHDGLRATLPL